LVLAVGLLVRLGDDPVACLECISVGGDAILTAFGFGVAGGEAGPPLIWSFLRLGPALGAGVAAGVARGVAGGVCGSAGLRGGG